MCLNEILPSAQECLHTSDNTKISHLEQYLNPKRACMVQEHFHNCFVPNFRKCIGVSREAKVFFNRFIDSSINKAYCPSNISRSTPSMLTTPSMTTTSMTTTSRPITNIKITIINKINKYNNNSIANYGGPKLWNRNVLSSYLPLIFIYNYRYYRQYFL